MKDSNFTIGFVYVLINESMPDLVKIGLTTWLPEDRSKQLFTTGGHDPVFSGSRPVADSHTGTHGARTPSDVRCVRTAAGAIQWGRNGLQPGSGGRKHQAC